MVAQNILMFVSEVQDSLYIYCAGKWSVTSVSKLGSFFIDRQFLLKEISEFLFPWYITPSCFVSFLVVPWGFPILNYLPPIFYKSIKYRFDSRRKTSSILIFRHFRRRVWHELRHSKSNKYNWKSTWNQRWLFAWNSQMRNYHYYTLMYPDEYFSLGIKSKFTITI